jgi:hypothetical protein
MLTKVSIHSAQPCVANALLAATLGEPVASRLRAACKSLANYPSAEWMLTFVSMTSLLNINMMF